MTPGAPDSFRQGIGLSVHCRACGRSTVALMVYLLSAIVVAFPVLLAWGAITGRVKVRSCCAADPRRDLRMRDAFPDQDTVAAKGGELSWRPSRPWSDCWPAFEAGEPSGIEQSRPVRVSGKRGSPLFR